MNKFLAGLEISRETRRAFRIARDGIDGYRDEAEVAAEIVSKAIDNSKPSYSESYKDAYVRSAMYRVYFKAAYPNADETSIDRAALSVAWASSLIAAKEVRKESMKDVKKWIEKIIIENDRAYPLVMVKR
jgi:ribonuclease HII